MLAFTMVFDPAEDTETRETSFAVKTWKMEATAAEVYYVMEGIIYQSPSFINLLMLKYNKINLYLQQTFQSCLQNVQHENAGHHCLNHSSVIPVGSYRLIPSTSGGRGKDRGQHVKIREFPHLQTTFDDLDLMLTSLSKSLEDTAEREEQEGAR
jgi:hypothetical protein